MRRERSLGICTSPCRWRGAAVSALQAKTLPVHTSRNRGRGRRVRRREGGRGVMNLCPPAGAFAFLQRQKVVLAWGCLGAFVGCGLGMLLCTFPNPGNQKRVLLFLAWSVLHLKLSSGQKERTSLKITLNINWKCCGGTYISSFFKIPILASSGHTTYGSIKNPHSP